MVQARVALTFADIVEIDRRMIQSFGGLPFVEPDNCLNGQSLQYILDVINSSMFGQELYPSIPEKAAAAGWTIMAKHVFHDGNKRTGMMVCSLLLSLNDQVLLFGYDDPEAMEVALAVADAEQHVSLEQFTEWVVQRVRERPA
jgi:death-on-curing protein